MEQNPGDASGRAVLSDVPVITQQLWDTVGSSFLSQLCSAQDLVPHSHAPSGPW